MDFAPTLWREPRRRPLFTSSYREAAIDLNSNFVGGPELSPHTEEAAPIETDPDPLVPPVEEEEEDAASMSRKGRGQGQEKGILLETELSPTSEPGKG